jgi:two-component system, OmpR family, sensor kinase
MSLRLRLALWSGGLIGLAMLLVGLLAYAVHGRSLYDDLDLMLRNAAEHAAEESAAAHASGQVTEVSPDIVVRVYDSDGRVVAASPNAASAPSLDPRALPAEPPTPHFDPIVGLAPSLTTVDAGQGVFGQVMGPDQLRWRLYLLPVKGEVSGYVLAAAPLDRIDAVAQDFRGLVTLLAVAGAAITVLAGWLVADHALRPVAALTDTARAITRSQGFGQRVQLGASRDELGRLAATFNEMLASLEQAFQAQQRFVSDASHELRAPLTAIQANLELLRRRRDMPEAEREEAVEEASRETTRLTQLVADLLALARADAGVPLRLEKVELDRVVLEALGQARHLARGQKIEIESLEPALVQGDSDRLKQLLLILLDNALKYTPSGGLVSVTMHRANGSVEVSVRDTGVGIAPKELAHVFERFYRADPARARDPGGTGLGLPIAKWIAGQHRGDVTLSSKLGHGTTATVRLPIV